MTLPAPLQAEIDAINSPEKLYIAIDIQERMDKCKSVIRQLMEHIEKVEDSREEWRTKCCNDDMAQDALQAIHELLDSGGVPRGTFADDHVRNLVAMYNQLRQAGDALREVFGERETFTGMEATALINYTNLTTPEKTTDEKIKSEILRRESVQDFLENDALENPP